MSIWSMHRTSMFAWHPCRACMNTRLPVIPFPRLIPSPAGDLGYLIGPEEVIEGAKKVHDFLTVGAAAPLQEAAVTGLEFSRNIL